DCILNQLLDHARGTFDHLAGGDAVDDLFGKLADGHGASVQTLFEGAHTRSQRCSGKGMRSSAAHFKLQCSSVLFDAFSQKSEPAATSRENTPTSTLKILVSATGRPGSAAIFNRIVRQGGWV